MSALKQFIYLAWWFFRARILGRRKPLQTVLFISDRCNLRCKHCSVYSKHNPIEMTYEQVREQLIYSYNEGSRFVDFEGGETMIWRDGNRDINDLIILARQIGFFSVTVTTNAQLPFGHCKADSIWVSMDGIGKYHDALRGQGTFEKLEKNIIASDYENLDVNMVVSTLNDTNVEETLEYVKASPYIKRISVNLYTPFPGPEGLELNWDRRCEVIDTLIAYKKKGYPILNSISGLKLMKHNKFKRHCWVTNFIYPDGTRSLCAGIELGVCDRCGLCMSGEMNAVFNLRLDTILAGLKLRL